MRKLFMLVVLLAACAAPALARQRLYGWCEEGGQTPTVQGFPTSIKVQGSFPPCTLTVYKTGSQSVQTGRYVSGGTITGTAGQTITLFINGGTTGATATATLTGTNTISLNSPLIINTPGAGYSGPPTTATCSSATATCSGTVTITTTVIGTLAAVYADNNGSVLSNPFQSSTIGFWYFYVDDGTVDIQMSGGGFPSPYTLGAVSANDPYFTQNAPGAVPVLKRQQAMLSWNVQQFGCPLPDGVTDETACLSTAANAASAAGATLYFPPNPITPACYYITKAILAGTSATTTFIDWYGSSQPVGANQALPTSCILQGTPGQDIVTINYANYVPTSISIRNLNFSYSATTPPQVGKVAVSGHNVAWVSGANFAPSWFQTGGNATMYIQGGAAFGCPGNLCNLTGVASSTFATIAQNCVSGCPTAANYTTGVAIHAVNPNWQTVDLLLDTVQTINAGIGFSSDGGTQSSTYRKGAFFNSYIGYNANGEILPHWIDWYFQAGTIGIQLTQGRLILNGNCDTCVFESQTGPAVDIEPTATMVGGAWLNTWFEFPTGDTFHVFGQVRDWALTGGIVNASSLPSNLFVVLGAPGAEASMTGITLTGGYSPNLNGGYLTVAENLAGVPTDPTSSSDPSFNNWYILGFDTAGGILRGFQTTATNGAASNFVLSGGFQLSQFAVSTVTGLQPPYVTIGGSATNIASINTNLPIASSTGQLYINSQACLGPNCTPVVAATLTVNNNLKSAGVVNTSSTNNLVTIVSINAGNQTLDSSWAGQPITINSVIYTVKAVLGPTTFTLASNPGNQTSVAFSMLGVTRQWTQAGPGQQLSPGVYSPLAEFADVNAVPHGYVNHDGYPTSGTENNTDVWGLLTPIGSGGPSGSGTATQTMLQNAVVAPWCQLTYTSTAAPASLPTVLPFYIFTLGPPTVLTVYGQAGVSLTYSCPKADQ